MSESATLAPPEPTLDADGPAIEEDVPVKDRSVGWADALGEHATNPPQAKLSDNVLHALGRQWMVSAALQHAQQQGPGAPMVPILKKKKLTERIFSSLVSSHFYHILSYYQPSPSLLDMG